PAAARANKGRRARGAPPSGDSSLGGPGAAFQSFLRRPGMHSPPSCPDVCPALRFLALALPDGAHFDVLVTQSLKKPFTSPHTFLSETKKYL
ncbi:unnamed protein product, partial [Gulo gulo]